MSAARSTPAEQQPQPTTSPAPAAAAELPAPSPLAEPAAATPTRRVGRPPTHGRYRGRKKPTAAERRAAAAAAPAPAPPTPPPPALRARTRPAAIDPRTLADPDPRDLGGCQVHDWLSTVTGAPRWSHELFPTDNKKPEEVRAYDIADAKYGEPEEIRIWRKDRSDGTLEAIPEVFAPDAITIATIARRFGGGTYSVRAFVLRHVEGDRVVRVCTRWAWTTIAGRPKPIQIAADDDDADDDDEGDEGNEGNEEEGRVVVDGFGALPAALAAQIQIQKMANEAERARLAAERDAHDRELKRLEASSKSDRERDREFFGTMIAMMKANGAPAAAPPPPDPFAEMARGMLMDIARERLLGGGSASAGPSTVQTIKEIAEPVIQQAGAAWLAYMQKETAQAEAAAAKAEAEAAKAEAEAGIEYEDDEDEGDDEGSDEGNAPAAAAPPPGGAPPARPLAAAPPPGTPGNSNGSATPPTARR